MPDTRTAILNLAEHLIRSKGYNAFSYKDIAQELNIKNAAIHYHFPSKADLGREIIVRTRQKLSADQLKWGKLGPRDQLRAFIRIYRQSNQNDLVCFMGALGPSFQSLPEIMRQELTLASNEIRSWLESILKAGKKTGEFEFKETVRQKSDMIISSLLSSLILKRVSGDDVLNNVGKAILIGV